MKAEARWSPDPYNGLSAIGFLEGSALRVIFAGSSASMVRGCQSVKCWFAPPENGDGPFSLYSMHRLAALTAGQMFQFIRLHAAARSKPVIVKSVGGYGLGCSLLERSNQLDFRRSLRDLLCADLLLRR
jgi:hypothetical protein